MKITKVSTSIFSTVAIMSVAISANAEEYVFNRHIGKVLVRSANVNFLDNGVQLGVNIHTPACSNQYHVEGSVTVKYTGPNGNGNASRTWNFSGSDEENIELNFADFLPYRQAPGGIVNVSTSSNCIYHGVRHGGINLPW